MYSQNNEEQILQSYFKDRKICLLSIGENDGVTLSNVRLLLLNGSYGTLVEPSPNSFNRLSEIYKDREDVHCINVAVSDYDGKAEFFNSGPHLNNGDESLLSSLNQNEIKRWGQSTTFEKIKVDVVDFNTLISLNPYKKFDFVSIDAESEDITILKQMDLVKLGVSCLCIEHNGSLPALMEILEICRAAGITKTILQNQENVIIAK